MTYSKLFSDIIHSTIWREPNHVRLVWITMLAMRQKDNCVHASLPGLADASRVTLEECIDALKVLSSPDPYSRTKDFEGRRVRETGDGWLILNAEKYVKRLSNEEKKERWKLQKRQYRENQKEKQKTINRQKDSQDMSAMSAHVDIDVDVDLDVDCNLTKKENTLIRKIEVVNVENKKVFLQKKIEDFFAYQKSIGKPASEISKELFYKRFSDYDHELVAQAIDETISNGWRTVSEQQIEALMKKKEGNYGKVKQKRTIADMWAEINSASETTESKD